VLPYLVVPGLVVAGVWGTRLVRLRERADAIWIVLGCVVAGVIALPVLSNIGAALHTSKVVLVDDTGLGNLAAPLKLTQALGIWLEGDYRYTTTNLATPQTVLLVMFAIASAGGAIWTIKRRAWAPILLAATLVPTSFILISQGSPYADAKVLVILSGDAGRGEPLASAPARPQRARLHRSRRRGHVVKRSGLPRRLARALRSL